MPTSARVCIVGGGVVGCSVAYHLTQLGWKDVVLLERKQLTCGTTWHAAGLLTTLRDTEAQTKLAKYTQDLYRRLEAETGQATGIINCGSIQLAMTDDKAHEMRRGCAMARCFGVENQEISAAEVKQMWPLADVSDVKAAFYFPKDGRVNPADVAQALAKGAKMGGARIFENTKVLGIETHQGKVVGVRTDRGDIKADFVVNCAGMWAREVGRMAGVNVPLQACEHYYLISESIEGVHKMLPILRDPGNAAYIREEAGKIMLGFFEPIAKPWGMDGIPENFCFDDIQADWDRMMPYMEKAMRRVPTLMDHGIKLFFCGPESFTPDHNCLMGPAPNLKNFFVAAGMNSLGILSGGGVGMVMSRWITEGQAPDDMWSVDLRRTHAWQDNDRYLQDRMVESLGIGYQDHWPFRQWTTARNVRKSVLHDRLAAAGACFGESAGWERPNWYAKPGQKPEYEYSWGRQNWFDNNAEEHTAVREAVGVFEQSSFSKFLVQGRDAEKVMNLVATANMSVPAGKVVYTQFLNEHGGIEADITVTRLEEDKYLVVTAACTHTHVEALIRNRVPADAFCVVTDVSGAWSMLNVQGPNARALLQKIAQDDLSHAAFPFGTAKEIRIGYQTVLALRLTYVGELGWELYIPTGFTLPVYDALVEAGAEFGLHHCGYHTLNSLRIEKAYREWAHDIGPHDTPLEAGLAFTCAWDKPGGFIGREALLKQKANPVQPKRFVCLALEDNSETAPMIFHEEPIYRNGVIVGSTTSGAWGHRLNLSLGLGYVHNKEGVTKDWVDSGTWEVELAWKRYPAKVQFQSFYDPKGERIKA